MHKRFAFLLALLASSAVLTITNDAFSNGRRHLRRGFCCPPVVCMPAPCCQDGMGGTIVPYSTYPGMPGQAVPSSQLPPVRTVTIKGKQYSIVPHPDRGSFEDEQDASARTLPPGAAGSDIPASERFMGTARRIAKTNIFNSNGEVKSFGSISALVAWLPKSQVMLDKHLPHMPTTDRVAEEMHNVTVQAHIYAFKKESDNDYHVILGDPPGTANPHYFNAEVSGIPIAGTDANRATLWQVRKAFQQSFELGTSGPASYFRVHPPAPVRVTGSIFWDVDHEHELVGPADFKPTSAWEIHPISALEFLE
jgi:hypothetical protein